MLYSTYHKPNGGTCVFKMKHNFFFNLFSCVYVKNCHFKMRFHVNVLFGLIYYVWSLLNAHIHYNSHKFNNFTILSCHLKMRIVDSKVVKLKIVIELGNHTSYASCPSSSTHKKNPMISFDTKMHALWHSK